MADPIIVQCPANTWTKVATNQTTGVIYAIHPDPLKPIDYKQTYRATGGAAPTDLTDAVDMESPLYISAGAGVDVYIWPTIEKGSVRTDV